MSLLDYFSDLPLMLDSAAILVGRSRAEMIRLAQAGKVPCTRLSDRPKAPFIFDRDQLVAWAARRETPDVCDRRAARARRLGLISRSAACARLGIDGAALDRAVAAGHLPAYRINESVSMFDPLAVDRLAARLDATRQHKERE